MMKLYASLFLLVNIFISISNGDICISGSTNLLSYGNYKEASGLDGNDNTYYVEETLCDNTNYLYFLPNYNYWTTGQTLNKISLSVYSSCSASSPVDCSSWTSSAGAASVSATGCPAYSSLLTDTCGSITISGAGTVADGSYNKIGDGQYQKSDGSARYFTYYEGQSFYVAGANVNAQCGSTGDYDLAVNPSSLDGLTVGDETTFTPRFTSITGKIITIACNSESSGSSGSLPAPVITPSPTAASATGGICFSSSYTGTYNGVSLANVAGAYELMANDINEKPAYKLLSGCGYEYYMMYVTESETGACCYNQYMVVADTSKPLSSRVASCGTYGDDDPLTCGWNGSTEFDVSATSGSCSCGLS